MPKRINYVQRASDILGTDSALARACGVTPAAILKAKRKFGEDGTGVSAELARDIELATNGKVERWRFRPDLWEPPAKAGRKTKR